MNKLPKVNLCCVKDESRPSMEHIEITKEHIVATDSHIMCILTTSEIFDKEFIETFPSDRFYIHSEDWKSILTAKTLEFISDNVIKATGNKKVLIEFKTDMEYKYPNWKSVIPNDKELIDIDSIGVCPKLLHNLYQAMPDSEYVKLLFTGKNKAIILKDGKLKYKSFGIIMPKKLHDE